MPGKDGTGPRWSDSQRGLSRRRRFCRRFNLAQNANLSDEITYLENLKKEIELEIKLIKNQEKIDE